MYTTKKAFCILIAAVMLMAVLPIASVASQIAEVRTEAYEMKKQSNAWLQFEAVEEEADRKGLSPKETTLAVYKAVLNNPNVDAGSLKWDGDNQFVFTIDGMHSAYCYRVRHTSCASAIGGKMLSDMKAMAMESSGGGNILLIEPYYGKDSIFTDAYLEEAQSIAAVTNGSVTVLAGDDATGPAIAENNMNKDIIIMYSHGAKLNNSNSTYAQITNISGLTQTDYSYGWAFCSGSNLAFIDGRYIKNHIPGRLSNTFIWMTICEGMALSTTGNALLEAGAGGVYGYTAVVTVKYDAECEQLFWNDMKNGATVAQAVADVKATVGTYDPYYSTMARPVVVSPTDPYPSAPYYTQTVNCAWTLPQGGALPTATPTAVPTAVPSDDPIVEPTATPTPIPTATPTPVPTVAPSTIYYTPVTTIETNKDYLIGYDDGTNIYLLMNSNPNPVGSNRYYYGVNTSMLCAYGIKAQRVGENVIDVDNSTYANATIDNAVWRFESASGGYKAKSKLEGTKYLYVIQAGSLTVFQAATTWSYSNGRLTFNGYNICYVGTVGSYSNFFATSNSTGSSCNIKLYKKTVAAPVNNYTVTFKDWNGMILKTEQVTEGGAATAPANPTRTGYTFTGWDVAFNNITANTVVTAQYSINSYTVTFKDWNGSVLKTETVNYGGAATAPADPTRTGYTFTGWDRAFNNITANTIVTAQYTPNATIDYYTVTFKDWDGTTLKTEQVADGSAATAPANPTRTGYTFMGWDVAFDYITADTVVTAQYSINSYTVTFKDWDYSIIKTETVNYGGAATAPADPIREGYTFTGWDRTFDCITTDTIVRAQYTKSITANYYTVTFKDWDGTVLKTELVEEGKSATAPVGLMRAGYTFIGWDIAFNCVTSDMIITAQYVENVAGDKFMPVNDVVVGKEYLIGYKYGNSVYLVMNYNPDPLASANGTNSYRYFYNSTYYAYGVKAVTDENGNIIDVDKSIYPNACLEYTKWKFITTSLGYRIRSIREATMYLTAHVNKKNAHLYVVNGYYNSIDWNWNSGNSTMTYTLKDGALKYMSFVPIVSDYINFFKAGTNFGTVLLYRKVEQIRSYATSNSMNIITGYLNID